ncbi:unnamed protein product, partial [Scytosiphon promiscuus]
GAGGVGIGIGLSAGRRGVSADGAGNGIDDPNRAIVESTSFFPYANKGENGDAGSNKEAAPAPGDGDVAGPGASPSEVEGSRAGERGSGQGNGAIDGHVGGASSSAGPPTPRSIPDLVSMSLSSSILDGEGLRQPRLSPNAAFVRSQARQAFGEGHSSSVFGSMSSDGGEDDASTVDGRPPRVSPRFGQAGQQQQQLQNLRQHNFRRSSSRFSSDAEEGCSFALSPLPEGDPARRGGGGTRADRGSTKSSGG